jgi:HEAT repeat protein
MNESRDIFMRCNAAFLIGELGEKKAIPWLSRAARLDESYRVRVHVYAAMARLGDKDALDGLLACLRIDTESRLIALQSLVRIGNAAAQDALMYELSNPVEFLETRLIAARALGVLGSSAGYALASENARASFKDNQDPNRTFRIRSLAALALGDIGDPQALPLLYELAARETDERVQVAAAYAICKLSASGAFPSAGSF